MMELLQLKYFQTVARHEHMTRAAQELRIAQPALSKTIALLEKDLGVSLFERRGKYIYLNQHGRSFLKKVNIALGALEDGKKELAEQIDHLAKEIRLSVIVGSNMLPELLASFRRSHHSIRFRLIQHSPQLTIGTDFDYCLSSSPILMKDVKSIPLLTEEIFLAVPADHPLAERARIFLHEAANEDFISLKPGASLRETTDEFCQSAGFIPNIVFDSDDPSTVRGLIKAGQGVAFIPAVTWSGSTGTAVKLLHIESPVCKRTIYLSWRDESYFPTWSILFRQFTLDYFSALAAQKSNQQKA